jgi:hypothetical protein
MRGSGRHVYPSVRDRLLSHLKTANSHGGHGPSITFSYMSIGSPFVDGTTAVGSA